MHCQTPMCN